MYHQLADDNNRIKILLEQTVAEAERFLSSLTERSPGLDPPPVAADSLPQEGLGTERALELFVERFGSGLTGSAGPRYFGFVTGGTTPAALVGDWLVSAFDQNAIGFDSSAGYVEQETIHFLRQLFGLPDNFFGSFVTGATVSNFGCLATARQWIARQHNVDLTQVGLYGLPPIKVLSGTPHTSIFQALSMLGMGKGCVELIPCLPEREAVDGAVLEQRLVELNGEPCIIVANAGTVNTVDFDDIQQIAALKKRFPFWLHVDGAFGGFAGCSPQFRHLLTGIEQADSVTIDAHKWLNVPYDAAMQFTPHKALQFEVFQASAVYLGEIGDKPDNLHFVPENSRRFRALPAWFTLMAYGRQGYREIVERNCALARQLGDQIKASTEFRLLAPVRLNVVCFTLDQPDLSMPLIQRFLDALRDDGRVFLTPTNYHGSPAIRAAISNWRTEADDITIAWRALQEVGAAFDENSRNNIPKSEWTP